jgi:hypothetical protein
VSELTDHAAPGCTCNMVFDAMRGWMHHGSCATQQWQPGHMNTMTSTDQRKNFLRVTAPERFAEHVLDPANDPERRKMLDDVARNAPVLLTRKTREELEKEAAAKQAAACESYLRNMEEREDAQLRELLKQQTTPLLVLPTQEAVALPNGKAAKAAMVHPLGGGPTRATTLPTGSAERKQYPIASGVLDYFPDAIAALSHLSWKGNDQHNPNQPVHWNRKKSQDEDDTLMRHFLQRGTLDTDGIRHSVKVAWRALALLQKELEEAATKEEAA